MASIGDWIDILLEWLARWGNGDFPYDIGGGGRLNSLNFIALFLQLASTLFLILAALVGEAKLAEGGV